MFVCVIQIVTHFGTSVPIAKLNALRYSVQIDVNLVRSPVTTDHQTLCFRCQNPTDWLILASTMAKSAKRRRKDESDDVRADTEKATPPITRLPFELVAEILLYSTSSADILSLTDLQAFLRDPS
jgi:hypothetical protein